MTPEEQLEAHKKETWELLQKVRPLLNGTHSFTLMMVIADIVAQWLRSHPPHDTPRLGTALIETISDRLDQLNEQDNKETRH